MILKASVIFDEEWLKKVAPYGNFVLFLSVETAWKTAYPTAKTETDGQMLHITLTLKKEEIETAKKELERILRAKTKATKSVYKMYFTAGEDDTGAVEDETAGKADDDTMRPDELASAISSFLLPSQKSAASTDKKSDKKADKKPDEKPKKKTDKSSPKKTADKKPADATADKKSDGEKPVEAPKSGSGKSLAELFAEFKSKSPESLSEKPAEAATEKEIPKNEKLSGIALQAKKLSMALAEEVKGQNHAIGKLVNGYFKMTAFEGFGKKKGAKATFLFAGPPGVGKTMLAELFAEKLKLPFLRVDMSEFSEDESHCSFNGLNPSYKAASEGKVTGFVRRNRKCVILFDEVEKAHINTLHLFYQMLDRGELQDVYHQEEVSFREAILIFTTNAGRNLYEEEEKNLSAVSDKTVMKALKSDVNPSNNQPYFPAALVSRMATGTIVMFNHLQPLALYEILERTLNKKVEELQKHYDLKFKVNEEVLSVLLYEEGGKADARTLSAKADRFLAEELRELLNRMPEKSLKALKKNYLEVDFTVDLKGAGAEIGGYFSAKKFKALVLCSEQKKSKFPAVDGVEYLFAHSLKDAKKIARQDVAFAIVDVFFGLPANSTLPSSADDVLSEGMDFVRYLRTYCEDLACYLLCDDKDGYGEDAYEELLAGGVRGLVPLSTGKTEIFKKALEGVKKNARIGEISLGLARSNMQLCFNSAQYFDAEGKRVEVRLQRLSLCRSVNAEDENELISETSRPTVKFSDIIGAKDAKETLSEFIGFLKDPRAYTARGVRPPRGVLLYGPPGTGKTMLAKALAGETSVAFFQKNSTEFFKSLVGAGPNTVRELFKRARKYAPAIIFIDEVDAFAKQRTGGTGNQSAEEILNAFLSEMDGFTYDEKRPVLIVAATNYSINPDEGNPRLIDSAFVRRFDRKIKIDLPNTKERAEFIRYYLAKHEISGIAAETIETLALRSYACSPADLEMIVELAIRNAKGGDLTDKLLTEAFDMERFGDVNEVTQTGLLQTTYHEAGHTLVAYLCGEKPTFVTNISRSNFGGYMLHEVDDTRTTFTRQELLNRICCSLAGRCAEILIYGDEKGLTTGASGDLRTANDLALQIVNTYGMSDGLAAMKKEIYGDAIGTRLFEKVEKILQSQYERAMQMIDKNRDKLEKLTKELMKKNSLSKDEIITILQ